MVPQLRLQLRSISSAAMASAMRLRWQSFAHVAIFSAWAPGFVPLTSESGPGVSGAAGAGAGSMAVGSGAGGPGSSEEGLALQARAATIAITHTTCFAMAATLARGHGASDGKRLLGLRLVLARASASVAWRSEEIKRFQWVVDRRGCCLETACLEAGQCGTQYHLRRWRS